MGCCMKVSETGIQALRFSLKSCHAHMCLKLEHKIEFQLLSWEKVWRKERQKKKSSQWFVQFSLQVIQSPKQPRWWWTPSGDTVWQHKDGHHLQPNYVYSRDDITLGMREWRNKRKETAKPKYIIKAADLSADRAQKLRFAQQLS